MKRPAPPSIRLDWRSRGDRQPYRRPPRGRGHKRGKSGLHWPASGNVGSGGRTTLAELNDGSIEARALAGLDRSLTVTFSPGAGAKDVATATNAAAAAPPAPPPTPGRGPR